MSHRCLRRAPPLVAAGLVLVAAAASLFGSEPVHRIVGSAWFLAGTGIVALTALCAAIIALRSRSWPSAVQHLGILVALVGIFVNQRAAHSSYLFLQQGTGAGKVALGRDLRRVEELPQPLALDSLTTAVARAFQPAPVAWMTAGDGRSVPVTYSRPLRIAGRQMLLTQIAAPGFLTEYEVAAGGSEYLLLHNQVAEPWPGMRLSSFAYDAEAGRVGLLVGGEQHWLGIGESTAVNGRSVQLVAADFAPNFGALFVVNDARYRFIVFVGFGLVLLGLLPPLFRREDP